MTHYSDRSRVETGHACERKRYWNYHYEGKGVVPVEDGLDLLFGKAIHNVIETGVPGEDFRKLNLKTFDQQTCDGYAQWDEWRTLYYGLFKTYNTFVVNQIDADYDWIGHEVEITFDLAPGIQWKSRLDGVLRRKADGLYFVLEAKTSSMPDKLFKSKDTNFQLLMECEAMRQHYKLTGDQVGGSLLLVFNKGRKQRASDGEGYRRVSPFTYWWNKGTKYSIEYKSGWDRVPTWLIPSWWDILMENWEEKAKEQVQLWPSISFDADKVRHILTQVKFKEEYLAAASKDYDLDVDFPQNFDNCSSDRGYGKPCPYLQLCNSPNMARNPIASELYEWRVANHPQEILSK